MGLDLFISQSYAGTRRVFILLALCRKCSHLTQTSLRRLAMRDGVNYCQVDPVFPRSHYPNLTTFRLPRDRYLVEQVMGFEPTFQPWQGRVLTTVRYLHMEARLGFEPRVILAYKASAIDHYAIGPFNWYAQRDLNPYLTE